MIKEDLKLGVSRIHKLDGSGATKAFCDLSVLDSFVIKGLRVVEGEKGLFVSMPQEAGKDGKWYNTVIPLNREVRDEIERLVLEAYGG
jgi:stage V sporulation protein G